MVGVWPWACEPRPQITIVMRLVHGTSMGSRQSRLGAEEARELSQSTHFSPSELNRWYKGFLRECPSGTLNEQEFCTIYKQFFPFGEPIEFATQIFRMFDVNGTGAVDFKEFITALSVTSRGTQEEKLSWCFKLFDIDKDGYITKQEMISVIDALHRMVGSMVEQEEEEDTPQRRVKHIFETMDTDQDGRLSKDEFIQGAKIDPSIAKSLSLFENLI